MHSESDAIGSDILPMSDAIGSGVHPVSDAIFEFGT